MKFDYWLYFKLIFSILTYLSHGIYDLTYSNLNTAIAVGQPNQKISRSTDGGSSWTLVNTGLPTMFLMGVDFADDYGIAAGSHGDSYYSSYPECYMGSYNATKL